MSEQPDNPKLEQSYKAKVFIDNPANQSTKSLYNEKSLGLIRTVKVSSEYPYPYGFFLNTTSGDGDNLDCFVITEENLLRAQIVEVEPIGIMEVIEDDEIDHKIIAQLVGESREVTDDIKEKLTAFIYSVFAHLPDKKMIVGEFLERGKAIALIESSKDDADSLTPEPSR